MRKNKVLLSFILFFAILLIAIPTFATENVGTINLNQDNYYKLREEVYKNKQPSKNNTTLKFNSSGSVLDFIIQEAYKLDTDIDISMYKVSVSEINALALSLVEVPELFFINPEKISYMYVPDPDTGIDYVTGLFLEYYMVQSEIDDANAIIDKVVADYLSGIKPEWNDLEKVIYTNNYLCKNCSYAKTILMTSHTLYGALVDKEPVCDGYSKAFKFLLNKVGVESVIVTSNVMNHAWSMVNVNGDYYHVDVTWNDDDTGVGTTSYVYFMCSDSGFSSAKRGHSNWVVENNKKATNTQYDNASTWQITKNYLIYKDNYWYYLNNNTSTSQIFLSKYDARNYATTSSIKTISLNQMINIGPGLTTNGEYLIFTTDNEINRMTYDGNNIINIFTLTGGKNVLFSVDYMDEKLYYDTLDVGTNGIISTTTRKTNLFGPFKPLKGISLDKTMIELEVGEKETVSLLLNPKDTSDDPIIQFSVLDTNVATVDTLGEVTAHSVGKTVLTVKDTLTGLSATCNIEVVPELVYTTLKEELIDDILVLNFPDKTVISTTITAENFPAIDREYKVIVVDEKGVEKTDSQYLGSYNKIIIKDKNGEIVREYTVVVGGDVTGDGRIKLYDAFQILKGILYSNKLTTIDKLIRDYNLDGKVAIYDAFRYIRKAILV